MAAAVRLRNANPWTSAGNTNTHVMNMRCRIDSLLRACLDNGMACECPCDGWPSLKPSMCFIGVCGDGGGGGGGGNACMVACCFRCVGSRAEGKAGTT